MQSPFPGMDPFLEEPGGWPGVHGMLIAVLREQLNERLGPDFIADGGSSVYIVGPDERRWVFPDIYVVEAFAPAATTGARGVIAAPVRIPLATPEALAVPHILIRDRATRAVVTLIEVVSPINKASATAQARQDFLRKRQETMASDTHWVEIDLLRTGERPAEVRGAGPYYAALKRAGASDLEVWPIGLRTPLPSIAIPLSLPIEDIGLDLQAALDLLFTRYRYAQLIDYRSAPPPPAFTLDDRQWVAEQIEGWLATQPA